MVQDARHSRMDPARKFGGLCGRDSEDWSQWHRLSFRAFPKPHEADRAAVGKFEAVCCLTALPAKTRRNQIPHACNGHQLGLL